MSKVMHVREGKITHAGMRKLRAVEASISSDLSRYTLYDPSTSAWFDKEGSGISSMERYDLTARLDAYREVTSMVSDSTKMDKVMDSMVRFVIGAQS